MRRLRMACAVSAVSVAVIGISACSSGNSGAGVSAPKGTTLTVEDYYTTAPMNSVSSQIYQACAKSIGDKVTVDHVPGNNLIAKVLQQGSSRTLPDVLMLDNPDIPQIASAGALSPLSDYGVSTQGFASSVIKVGTYDGKLYGLAPAVNSLGLFYNKSMFAAAGITEPPATWAQLTADAKKLTKPGVSGFALGAYPDEGDAWSFLPFMWTNGGNEKNISTQPTVQAMQFLAAMVKDGSMPENVVNMEQGDVALQFQEGKIAMMVNGPWNIKPFEQTSLKWGAAALPPRVTGQTVQSPLGGETFTVPETANKANMAAAGKIVSCINEPGNQWKIYQATGNIPSITAQAAKAGSSDPNVKPFVGIVAAARSRTAELGAKWPAAAKAIYTAEGLAFTGKATAAAALAQAQAQAQGR